MPRLYTYIVRQDTGLAPNPLWDWCTLAVCTPNRQGARLEPGDWVAGFLGKGRRHAFLFAMVVEEVLDLDEYFRDARFALKRPDLQGDWMARCGDNFYSRDEAQHWVQHRNRFHVGEDYKVKDTRRPRVFVGRRFWYRGSLADEPPADFAPLIGGRGIRVHHDPDLAASFRSWVSATFEEGMAAPPNDNPDRHAEQRDSAC
jgi:hypothetical protein